MLTEERTLSPDSFTGNAENNPAVLPPQFTDSQGSIWFRISQSGAKPFRVFPSGEDPQTSTRFKAYPEEAAQQAYADNLKEQPAPIHTGSADNIERIRQATAFVKEDMKQAGLTATGPAAIDNAPIALPHGKGSSLDVLLSCEAKLAEAATRAVVFSPPLITRADVGIIRRNTINIVQGAYGSHKSRLAELIGALMLAKNPAAAHFLGLQRAALEQFCLCYIDTERNQNEELPHALQTIKLLAGYDVTDKPANFRFTTLKPVRERRNRFEAIEAFLSHVRASSPHHLFCIIDVATDAGGDFNDPKEAMRLLDFIGYLCDEQDATFLLVIHQNPGTEKARGHTGTEAANKASTVLQIGYERDANGNDTDLIRLRYLKLRRSKRPEPVYLQFSEATHGLVLADAAAIAANTQRRKHKADVEDVADFLTAMLADGALPKSEVWAAVEKEFDASRATARARIAAIQKERPEMYNVSGQLVCLDESTEGQKHFYRLIPVEPLSEGANC
jgi:hypothetical protein